MTEVLTKGKDEVLKPGTFCFQLDPKQAGGKNRWLIVTLGSSADVLIVSVETDIHPVKLRLAQTEWELSKEAGSPAEEFVITQIEREVSRGQFIGIGLHGGSSPEVCTRRIFFEMLKGAMKLHINQGWA